MWTCSVWKLWTIFLFILLLSPVTSSTYSHFYLFSPSSRLWELLFLEGKQKRRVWKRKEKKRRFPLPLAVCSLFFLLTWQRDNPSRFTSSEFTFTTFRITYLILKSYMGVWYPPRMSGISASPEGLAKLFLPARRVPTFIPGVFLSQIALTVTLTSYPETGNHFEPSYVGSITNFHIWKTCT